MKDLKAIVEAYRKVDTTVRKSALATVVKVRGSSYRSPGARMLITDDGKWVGSISGGCLEGDALRKARQVMSEKKPVTVTYDTREESNQNLGIGLGCNGVIDVLLEPIESAVQDNPINLFGGMLEANEPAALGTVVSGAGCGEKIWIRSGLVIKDALSDRDLSRRVISDLQSVFDSHRSETRTYSLEDGDTDVFLELIQPVLSLILFGGGFDARPVSQLAKSLGWNVSVTDECVAHIAPIFFPEADNLSLCKREYVDRDFEIGPYTACVLMSHNYEYDRDVLRKLLGSPAPYIGILGPKKRFDKMLEEFGLEGIKLSAADFDRIHSPIGLDIGAEAPDEIAVAIVAEVQSKFAGKRGGFLKHHDGPIHRRERESDQVFKQVYLSPVKNSG